MRHLGDMCHILSYLVVTIWDFSGSSLNRVASYVFIYIGEPSPFKGMCKVGEMLMFLIENLELILGDLKI